MKNPNRLNGQWIGSFGGSAAGQIHVNIDEEEQGYRGVAYLFENDPQFPHTIAQFYIAGKNSIFSFRTELIQPIDPGSFKEVQWESIQAKYPEGTTFSKYADVQGSCQDDVLTLSWTADNGVTGKCSLPRSRADQPSDLVPRELDWDAYKEEGIKLAATRPLFRGQAEPWRLRTPFHRTGRANMRRFVLYDIPTLYRHLSPRMKHVFQLKDENEYGAFLSLAQHHGYPTPILDWTYSPYIAAFFAYQGISNEEAADARADAKVRIFAFDAAAWNRAWKRVTLLDHPQLHLTVFEFIAIENERMIPQQAASTVTTVDDIETYIRARERDKKTTYLQAIDLPVRERKKVIRELSYMGITIGSLFPGLDGACKELAERSSWW